MIMTLYDGFINEVHGCHQSIAIGLHEQTAFVTTESELGSGPVIMIFRGGG